MTTVDKFPARPRYPGVRAGISNRQSAARSLLLLRSPPRCAASLRCRCAWLMSFTPIECCCIPPIAGVLAHAGSRPRQDDRRALGLRGFVTSCHRQPERGRSDQPISIGEPTTNTSWQTDADGSGWDLPPTPGFANRSLPFNAEPALARFELGTSRFGVERSTN